jgi:hypothetical protein
MLSDAKFSSSVCCWSVCPVCLSVCKYFAVLNLGGVESKWKSGCSINDVGLQLKHEQN